MREVARLRDRAADNAFAVREQRVEIVDERLHLGRVFAAHAGVAALVDGGQASAELMDRRESAPYERKAGSHEDHRERDGYVMVAAHQRREALKQHDRRQVSDREQAGGPQRRTQEEPPAERPWPRHCGAPIIR